MPIVKKATKVTGSKTVVKAGGIANKGAEVSAVGQRYLQFYYSISVAGDKNTPDIFKFNGNVPIGPVGGPPHFPETILHALNAELRAEIRFRAAG